MCEAKKVAPIKATDNTIIYQINWLALWLGPVAFDRSDEEVNSEEIQ